MNRQFHNMRQSLMFTDKQAGVADYSTNQKNFTGHMFNIKLEEKSYKMLQYSGQKTDRGAQCALLPEADMIKTGRGESSPPASRLLAKRLFLVFH